MKPILVLYATREGHTARIAEHVAATLRSREIDVDVFNVAQLPEGFSLGRYSAAVLAASVHGGGHEREMVAFAKKQREPLDHIPTAFLSVSLSETTVEDLTRPEELRAQTQVEVQRILDRFLAETGWRPTRMSPVAGALLYQEYGLLKRFVMRMITKKSGGPTDTSRDYVFTDWVALDRFVDSFATAVFEAAA